MHIRRLVPVIVMTLAALPVTSSLLAQRPAATLLVLSKREHSLSMVDPGTLKVTASADVGKRSA